MKTLSYEANNNVSTIRVKLVEQTVVIEFSGGPGHTIDYINFQLEKLKLPRLQYFKRNAIKFNVTGEPSADWRFEGSYSLEKAKKMRTYIESRP